MASFTVVYDACVFYPAPLRDLLMQLATTGLFRARWTDRIHDEWIRNLLKNRPDLKKEALERTRKMVSLQPNLVGFSDFWTASPVSREPKPFLAFSRIQNSRKTPEMVLD